MKNMQKSLAKINTGVDEALKVYDAPIPEEQQL
jgi:hypothetical protein